MATKHSAYAATVEVEAKANRSTAQQWERFSEHRGRLTNLLVESVSDDVSSRPVLGVLGAGNTNDLDLARLLRSYAEIHLFDLDESALARAVARLDPEDSARVIRHESLDLSGAIQKLPRWAAMQVTPEELMGHPRAAVESIASKIGMRFDRVVSPCIWTQLHLHVLQAFGTQHRLLEAVSYTTSLTHLRLLETLLDEEGKALFATELTSNETADLPEATEAVDHLALLRELSRTGNAIAVAHPDRLAALNSDDPVLRARASWTGPREAWIWQQGPQRRYIAYAAWLERRNGSASSP
jgi:hypothetical protein